MSDDEPVVERTRPIRRKKVVTSSNLTDNEGTKVWFGKTLCIERLKGIKVNKISDDLTEIDVLSVAVNFGIKTYDELCDFMTRDSTLKNLAIVAHHGITREDEEVKSIVTHYVFDLSGDPCDPRISQRKPPSEYTELIGRWSIPGFLIKTLVSLLTENQRPKLDVAPAFEDLPCLVSSMVLSFRGKRCQLQDISSKDIEAAELEAISGGKTVLLRELLEIRKTLHRNAENGLSYLQKKLKESEAQIQKEKLEKIREVDLVKTECISLRKEIERLHDEKHNQKELGKFQETEFAARQNLVFKFMVKFIKWPIILIHKPQVLPEELIVFQRPADSQELENAKLEIERLKNDSKIKRTRGQVISKFKRNPDLHFATNPEMISTVKNYLQQSGIISRQKFSPSTEDFSREMREADELKRLSMKREEELQFAETSSKSIEEITHNLSVSLTSMSLTIEEMDKARRGIDNLMKMLSNDHASITMILRQRPYLLHLAQRMNRERKPVVNFQSLQSLINIAQENVENLKKVDSIKIRDIEMLPLFEAARFDGESISTMTRMSTPQMRISRSLPSDDDC